MNPLDPTRQTATPFSSTPQPWPEPIAIIGMSARFPRSRNLQEFWDHLLCGDSLIASFTEEELRRGGVTQAMLAEPSYVRRGNVLDDADSFDAEFFGLSRREAEILDPQHRVFLECAWEALENAGHTGDGRAVGVFAGTGMNTSVLQLLNNSEILASTAPYQLMLASDKDFLATRTAYKLNLRGPAVTLQTACSTSLAAVHLACRSLLSGECSMALAGGVSIPFPQAVGYSYVPGMILSPDGYCRPFDAQASGTVPGRGAGVVVLRRLSEALADGDSIVAVIRGSAWNNDGAGKVGYTAPSIDGQAEVIRTALAVAGADPAHVGYVETHGTATELGDAIEFAALSQVFAKQPRKPLVLGAVKANMGHADAAAGVAGLIKAALAVQSGTIPATPGFTQPNPALGLETTPFVLSSSSVDWTSDPERWAGVSSFGIGGTNVHVVLSRGPAADWHDAAPARPRIFPVSARTLPALQAACKHLSQHLAADSAPSAADVAATLQLGRRAFPYRRAVVAATSAEAAASLLRQEKKSESGLDLARDVVFLFPGQGQQFLGMAEGLYREDPAFRSTIDAGCAILEQHSGLSILRFLAGSEKTPELSAAIRETQIAQPLLFLVEYALARRWRALGVEPAALLGHSLGELTAACVAGVFSFEDGLRLAAERGRLMAQTAPGLMLAVMLPPEKLADCLSSGLWLAAENGPKVTVASGAVDAVEALERRLSADGVAAMRLISKNAFHTPLMSEAAKAFREAVAVVPRHAPTIPWLSNVSGTWIGSAEAQDPQYWANQILSPVRFTRNLSVLAERRRFLLEVGPGRALLGLARHQMPTSIAAPSLGAEDRAASDEIVFLQAVARAWECGVSMDWGRLHSAEKHRRVPLPTYPFQRQRCSVEKTSANSESPAPLASRTSAPAPVDSDRFAVKREDISSWFYAPGWQSTPPATIALPAQRNASACWLVLAGDDPVSRALVPALRAQGSAVVPVIAGDRFFWQDGTATVNPSDISDLHSLWQQLDDSGLQPSGLLDLWSLGETAASTCDVIPRILQSAGSRRRHLRQFECITSSLQSVSGEPIRSPERAELYGLAATIPTELPGVECRCIDIEMPATDVDLPLHQILEELSTCGPNITVALRRGQRWQRTWTPAPLREGSPPPFRSGGVYLITGGIGGVGYVLARHLLSDYAARVVLTGRTALPSREQWPSWLNTHDEDDTVSRRIHRMQDLESCAGEVLFVAADVTDRDAMRSVIDQAQQRLGPLHGVIHAAGISGDGRLIAQSVEQSQEVRRPKVQGALVLADLFSGTKIDFLLFCSSISAVAPAPAQGAYAAANAFLNTFAEYCRISLGLPAVALGFDSWRDVGMLAEIAVPARAGLFYENSLHRAMSTTEGIEVIRRVLAQWRGPQILTCTAAIHPSSAPSPSEEMDSSVPAEVAPEAIDLAVILEIWKELLGADSIDPSDNFFTLGGHSLMGTMMIARIRDRLGVTLSLRHLFDASTPAQLAQVVGSVRQENPSARAPELVEEEREVFEI